MGGSIEDAFGGIGPFITNGYCRFCIIFSIIGTLLVKITDQMQKKQVQKALNIGTGFLLS
jgi:Na+/H+-translocating membrane pyrophosphatase